MQHLPPLISDLALILGSAAVTTLIFKKLRQPVVLGYIIAGLLVGPNFNLFPTVIEMEGIKTWAEIGVLFLLFGLGLEFSFKKMLKVGAVALISALMGIGLTLFTGYVLGALLGWSNMDSLFLGGILSIASTTIIIRAFDELGVKARKFAGIVMGVLVIEDLVAVVLMVVLSTVSISRTFEGVAMATSIFKLIFFLILWFVSGIFFLPSLLKSLRSYLNEETLLIVSLALCFLMVMLSTNAGFSPALGAFIMGSILAETTKAEKIEHSIVPLKNLFGAIFFVSVGMLINIDTLVEFAGPIALATLVLLLGKPLFVSAGALLSGESLKTSIQAGMSLSQIGEFSFIIATLGLTLKVTSDFLYPIAVAVSVLTTFTTPFMIRLSEPFYQVLERKMPKRWKESLTKYGLGTQKIAEASAWRKLLRFYLINVVLFSVIIISIILLSTIYLVPLLPLDEGNRLLATVLTLMLLSPFLWALAFRRTNREAYSSIWSKPNQRGPLFMLLISRVALSVFYIGLLFHRMYSPWVAIAGVLVTLLLLYLFRDRIRNFYGKIETRFLSNLNEREQNKKELAIPDTPWNSHLAEFEIHPWLPCVGKTLVDLKLRENYGVNVASILRGGKTINVPSRSEVLFPGDRLTVLGTDDQLKKFREYLDATKESLEEEEIVPVTLHHFTVHPHSIFVGKSIEASGIRSMSKGLVAGIERNGEQILNPESGLVFQEGDTVWLLGDEKRILVLMRKNEESE